GGVHGPAGSGWLGLGFAGALLLRAGSAGRRGGAPPRTRQVVVAVLVALAALLVGGKLYSYLEIDAALGVWRLAVFGALLAGTLRFAPNGLFTPLLDYFAGRAELRAPALPQHRPAAADTTPTAALRPAGASEDAPR
ncbi:MAG TPA: hypothetical protein VFA45_18280, partial [Actinomycetes bacterium]|nr:hypothetical protein [Actinomycetes bacterium]